MLKKWAFARKNRRWYSRELSPLQIWMNIQFIFHERLLIGTPEDARGQVVRVRQGLFFRSCILFKDRIEIMNWILNFFVGFENFEEFSQILAEKSANITHSFHFLEFLAKFRQNFITITPQMAKSIRQIEKFNSIQYSICKNCGRFFAEILNLERCKGLQIF